MKSRADPPAFAALLEQGGADSDAKAEPRRKTPALVVFVSPDRMTRPDAGESWFVATNEVDAKALKHRPQIRLHAGIPAEVFVATTERTLFEHLVKPLGIFASRAMRGP